MVLKAFNAELRKNSSGNTPLHWAAQNGKVQAIEYLLSNYEDCDVLDKNDFGLSVLSGAFGSNNQVFNPWIHCLL